jgi:hypothetical protein
MQVKSYALIIEITRQRGGTIVQVLLNLANKTMGVL